MNQMIVRLAITATTAALVIVALTTKDRVTALPVVHAAGSNPGCSVSTLKGDYAVHGQGTVVAQLPNLPPPPFQFAEVAIATLDGAGNLSGKATLSLGGIAVQGTFSGTYSVNSDCTGTVALQTSLGIPVNESLVAVGNRGFVEVDTDQYIAITRLAERIGD
jgi:hypothetical protein